MSEFRKWLASEWKEKEEEKKKSHAELFEMFALQKQTKAARINDSEWIFFYILVFVFYWNMKEKKNKSSHLIGWCVTNIRFNFISLFCRLPFDAYEFDEILTYINFWFLFWFFVLFSILNEKTFHEGEKDKRELSKWLK